jgi:hypothetical protein
MANLEIAVYNQNAITFVADVLALKYSEGYFGVSLLVQRLLEGKGQDDLLGVSPAKGEFEFIPTNHFIGASYILVVGTDSLWQVDYAAIRELGYDFVAALRNFPEKVAHLAVTLHGTGYGLDVRQAFRAELFGIVNAINNGVGPDTLTNISFVEMMPHAAAEMKDELDALLATHPAVQLATTGHLREEPGRKTQETDSIEQLIFISYARKDEAVALQLTDDLTGRGIQTWIDQVNIRPGQRWDKMVQEALLQAPLMLLLLSHGSSYSENVADEYHYFLQNQKTIIPVLISDFEMKDMPYRLSRFQYIDFRNDYQLALDSLVEAIHHNLNLTPR